MSRGFLLEYQYREFYMYVETSATPPKGVTRPIRLSKSRALDAHPQAA
jgi:hypothetical protein